MSKELGKNKPGEFTSERAPTQENENQKEQLLGNSIGHQELGKNPEDELYESEKRHKSFQRRNKSFDEQRDQYAEHAMNQDENVSYSQGQQDIPADEPLSPSGEDGYYKRYITQNNIQNHTVYDSDSTIMVSDKDPAISTEYQEPNGPGSNFYQKQINKFDSRQENTLSGGQVYESAGNRYRTSKSRYNRLASNKNTAKLESRKTREEYRVHNKPESSGRLKFNGEKNHKLTGTEIKYAGAGVPQLYSRMLSKTFSRGIQGRLPEDDNEVTDTLCNTSVTLSRELYFLARRRSRRLKSELDNSRLKNQNMRLKAEKQSKANKSNTDLQKRKAEETAKQKQLREKEKKKIKKEMVQTYHREQNSFIQRTGRQRKIKRVTKKERVHASKRTKAIIGGLGSLFLVFLVLLLTILLCIAIGAGIFSESYVNSTSQNTYWDMSAVTGYFRQKEADLEEYIKPENLEPIILEEEPDIYEFIYELDEISFDANTLVAYLSARYNEFNLEMVAEDLNEIFELYYTLSYEIKMEYRKVPDETQPIDPNTGTYPLVDKLVPICYVRLEKGDFYAILKERIEDAVKQGQMDAFYLTGNGQQVYGPVMNIDWRNKISSNYGERIHPITGERKKHNGVDIAVPTGTALYSAVTGTVIDSHYSNSAGNMITVQTTSGWTVTFMHMDSRAVSVGSEVVQGQLLGYSGNTGNSTGPHLHLEVKNESGEYVNPVFIIPFSTAEASETFKGGK